MAKGKERSYGPEERRAEILSRSPYLRTFLDLQRSLKTGEWVFEALFPVAESIEAEIGYKYGPGSLYMSVIPLETFLQDQETINVEVEKHLLYGFIESCMIIGWEVEEFGNADLFTSEIMSKAREMGVFRSELVSPSQRKKRVQAREIVRNLIESGINLKLLPRPSIPPTENPPGGFTPMPSHIRSFVEKLPEIKDLGK